MKKGLLLKTLSGNLPPDLGQNLYTRGYDMIKKIFFPKILLILCVVSSGSMLRGMKIALLGVAKAVKSDFVKE